MKVCLFYWKKKQPQNQKAHTFIENSFKLTDV